MPQAASDMLLFCYFEPLETLCPFFPSSPDPPQTDPTAQQLLLWKNHSRNCPTFSHLVYYSQILFMNPALGLPIKQCSLWKALSMDLGIPKRALVAPILVAQYSIQCLNAQLRYPLFVTSGVDAGPFPNQMDSSVQKGWKGYLKQYSLKIQTAKPSSVTLSLPLPPRGWREKQDTKRVSFFVFFSIRVYHRLLNTVPCATHFGLFSEMREKARDGEREEKVKIISKISRFLLYLPGEGKMKAKVQPFILPNRLPKKWWGAHNLIKSTFVLLLRKCYWS